MYICYQEKIKFLSKNILQICFVISIAFHVYFLIGSKHKIIEGEINKSKYKLVQLVNIIPENNEQKQLNTFSKPSIPKPKMIDTAKNGEIKSVNVSAPATETVIKDTLNVSQNLSSNVGVQDQTQDVRNLSNYVPFFKVTKLPEFIKQTDPIYPPKAKLKGVESFVLLEVYIDENGIVRHIIVIKSGGTEFDFSAIDAIKKSSFSPAISKEGQKVPVRVRIPLKFELS